MKQLVKKKIINMSIFILYAFVLQCISFLYMFTSMFPTYFFLDLIVYVLLACPVLFFKNFMVDMIYYPILMLLLCILWGVNGNYLFFSNDIFSLQYFSYINEGFSVVDASMINFGFVIIIFVLYFITTISIIKINLKNKIEVKEKKLSVKLSLIGVITLVISTFSYSIGYNQVMKYEIDKKQNYILDLVTLAKPKNFETLGMMSYYLKELDYLFLSDNSSKKDMEEIGTYLTNNKQVKNEYTGLLNGYNVVTIMIETGISQMVNETLTPNLYMMLNDGINCVNSYCKNKTNVSEYIGIVGNYPTSGLTKEKDSYVLPFSLPEILNDTYNTYYFHDVGQTRDIYSRKKLIPALGFENSYFHEDIHPTIDDWHWGGNYPLDSLTIDFVIDNILSDISKPFYAHYTTLSMHGPYVNPSNEALLESLYYDDLNHALKQKLWVNPLQDTVNKNCMINFMMAVMDFDKALGKMIDAFKEKGVFDNTLFVLYGDHDLYYKGADGIAISFDLYDTDDIKDYRLYNTVLGFYNSKLNQKISLNTKYNNYENFTSINAIVPTILDLLGIAYIPNIYLGDSIFSFFDEYQIFYSYEISSFFNQDYLSSNGIDIEIVFNENATPPEKFVETMTQYVIKQSFIDKIYQSNVFKKYSYDELI